MRRERASDDATPAGSSPGSSPDSAACDGIIPPSYVVAGIPKLGIGDAEVHPTSRAIEVIESIIAATVAAFLCAR